MQSFVIQKAFIRRYLSSTFWSLLILLPLMLLFWFYDQSFLVLALILFLVFVLPLLIRWSLPILALSLDKLLPRQTALLQFGHLDITPFPGEEDLRLRAGYLEKKNRKWHPTFYGRLYFYQNNKPLPLKIPLEATREELLALPQPPRQRWIKVTYYRFSRILISWEVMPVKEKKKCRTWK